MMLLRKMTTIMGMALSEGFIYRVDLLIFVLSGIVRPFVLLTIWLAIVNSGANVPYSSSEFIQYYVLVMMVGVFVSVWTAPFLSARIRQGRISPYLVKPISYLIWDLSQNIGEKIFKFIYLIPILIGVLILGSVGLPTVDLVQVVFILSSLLMAFLLSYLINYCIGLTAFWIDDSRSVDELVDLLSFIFSGRLVPIDTLPVFWQHVLVYLPFRYTLSFPIEIYLNKLSLSQMVEGTAIQLFWLVSVVILYKILWLKGIRRYSSSGA